MAVSTPKTARLNLLPAHQTLARVDRHRLSECDVTGARAEANRSPLARHERHATHIASERTARSTSDRTCSPFKDIAAHLTRPHHPTVWKRGAQTSREFGRFPRHVIGPRMTWAAESHEVIEPVRLIMRRKQAERFRMIHRNVVDGATPTHVRLSRRSAADLCRGQLGPR